MTMTTKTTARLLAALFGATFLFTFSAPAWAIQPEDVGPPAGVAGGNLSEAVQLLEARIDVLEAINAELRLIALEALTGPGLAARCRT